MDIVCAKRGGDRRTGRVNSGHSNYTCALLHGFPPQRVMASADWPRQTTPLRHYMRLLPEETLRADTLRAETLSTETLRAAEERQFTVRDAVLP